MVHDELTSVVVTRVQLEEYMESENEDGEGDGNLPVLAVGVEKCLIAD